MLVITRLHGVTIQKATFKIWGSQGSLKMSMFFFWIVTPHGLAGEIGTNGWSQPWKWRQYVSRKSPHSVPTQKINIDRRLLLTFSPQWGPHVSHSLHCRRRIMCRNKVNTTWKIIGQWPFIYFCYLLIGAGVFKSIESSLEVTEKNNKMTRGWL
jgi:hypothetical protein